MKIVDTKIAPPQVIAKKMTIREAEEILYKALNLMQLLKAGVPVTSAWIKVRDSLRDEAQTLFETVN